MSNIGKYQLISSPDIVQLWSSKRIQLESNGWRREMKKELKSTLQALETGHDLILYACYISTVDDFVDVENVLFYNVGDGAFSKICKDGIVFERGFELPPLSEDGMAYDHYQFYTFIENDQIASKKWRQTHTLARWETISLGYLSSSAKLRDIWHSMVTEKIGAIQIKRDAEIHSKFGISLMLTALPESISNLANVIKALLDGIISAFQVHNGMDIGEVSRILALQLREDSDEIQQLLSDRRKAILGETRLLKKFRNGVQWNPADDRLVYCRISVNRNEEVERVSCSGEIFEVSELASEYQ